MEETRLYDWFNINDQTHLKALEVKLQTTEWPERFMPADVYEHYGNDVAYICEKITKTWIEQQT